MTLESLKYPVRTDTKPYKNNIMNQDLKLKISLIVFIIVITFGSGIAQIKPLVVDCPVNSITPTTLSAGRGAGQVYPTVSVSTLNNCTNYSISKSGSWLSYSKSGLNVTITVSANTGPARTGYVYIGTQTLTVNQACGNLPGAAGSITGTSSVCRGQSGVPYSVAAVAGATGYSWTLPSGATIVSGANTNSITVNYATSALSGVISVRGTNSCASGSPSPDYSVTVRPLPSITVQPVNSTIVLGQDATFSVTATGSNLQYQWQSSPNGVDLWTNLTGLPAINYQTSTLTIQGSMTFVDTYYRCQINSDCGTLFTNNVNIILSFPTSNYLSDIPDPETRQLNTSYLVGATIGSFNIDPRGGATYAIPLQVPPGVNGLAPSLSIAYSSNGGSGIPGFGWQIDGISTISLGGRTAYSDDDYPADNIFDRFYLDGQRLQPNLSYSVYGDPNTQYQTENDIFTRVTPEASDPNYGPTWFKAETKSGLVFEYGNSSSSRQRTSPNSRVLNWYVSKMSDLFGNYINFTYIQDHYSVYPSEITYGPNDIIFYYKQRSDKNPYVLNGLRIEQWLLLDKVVIKYNSNVIKTYEFKQSYQGSNYNSYSILNEIIEYGLGSSRLNSTVFSYQIPENVSFSQTTYNTTHVYVTYQSRLITGDFNGDGKADFLCIPDPSKGAIWTGLRVYFSDGADNFTNPITSNISLDLTKLKDIRVMDINGDGIDDILYEYANAQDPSKSDFNYILCDGSSLSQPVTYVSQYDDSHTGMTGKLRRNGNFQEDDNERVSKIMASRSLGKNNLSSISPSKTKNIVDADFNGDGKNDVFINDPNGHCQIWYYSSGQMNKLTDITFLYGILSSDVLCGDFNGDGLVDLWSFENTGLKIFGYDYGVYGGIGLLYSSTWPTNHHFFILGDFNGDGKTDLFLYGYKDNNGTEYDWSDWQIQLSTGTGFEQHDVPQKKANLKNDNVRTGDFNGDGANDLMVTSKDLSWTGTYFYISMNNGINFYTHNLPGYPTASHNYYLADYDGDGRTDFICTDGVSPWWTGYQVYKSLGNTSILMNKLADGYGSLTKLTYTKLSQAPATVYVKDHTAIFPVMDFQGPWSVVSSVQADNGKGSLNTLNYFYEGAKVHLKGKGFIEFAKTSVSDLTSGIETGNVNSYNASYSYPTYFYPTLIKSYSKTIASDTIETVKNIWSQVILDGFERRVFPYIQSSTQLNKLTGLSITSSAQYDFYGNPTSIVKNYLNGSTETTTNAFNNTVSSSQWLLGRPTSTSVQYTGSSPTITRSGTRTFDLNNNHLLSETWYSGTGNQITKGYAYNSNGTIKRDSATVNSVSRSNNCTYESDYIRIHTSTDQLSHITTNSYDNNGRHYTQQDYLGNIVTYQYDALGRVSSASSNDGSQATTVYAWEDPASDPVFARYSVQKTGNDGSQTKNWFDKLGREIRSGVKGFDGTMIYTSIIYNIKGQVESVSDPYYSNGTALLNTFIYDTYGRKTSQAQPSGRNTTWVYNSNTITETTAGKSFSKIYSSDGTISSATDAGGIIAYSYYNDGKVKTITAPGGIVTSIQYDPAGNQNQLVDPSAGTLTYTYNGFGELTYQQNAKAQTTQLTYLPDGRPNQKILSLEGTTTYSYNSNKQLTGISSPGGVSRSLGYDTKGRITTNIETIPGSSSFTTSLVYDDKGRIRKIVHPSGITETKHYNQNGYLDSISTNCLVRWTTTGMNARQQVTSGQYWQSGGSLNATFGYDTYGYPTSTVAGTIQNYSYNFNPVTGNINWRQNNKYSGLREDFQYDNLDRLSNVSMNSTTTLNMSYDNNKGGIITKSDAGTLLYGNSQHPYAVSSINPTTGLTPSTTQTITYTSFECVNTISENNYNASLTYNADNQRALMIVTQGSGTILTRWYPTGSYIKETAGSVTKEYTFIGGDSYTAPIVAITQSGTTTYYNILRDYLGNITHIVNATTGAVTAEYSFDSWGRMRNPSTWVNYAPGSEPVLFVAGRGFTGHEHLPWFNLINMNGRVYDPLIAMFLSPDNYVQNPDLTQNFNRYGYCLNNPLKYSDPSGMLFAPAGVGDAACAYFAWMCDVAGPWHYTDMGGGGGGGMYSSGSGGANENWVGEYLYESNVKFYGYSYNTPANTYYSKYTGQVAPYSEVYNNYIAPNSEVSLNGDIAQDFMRAYQATSNSLNSKNLTASLNGCDEIPDLAESLKFLMPVAFVIDVGISWESAVATSQIPGGTGIILRGINAGTVFFYSSGGVGGGWFGVAGCFNTAYFFYSGDVNKFSQFSLEGKSTVLSFSAGEGVSFGRSIIFMKDNYGNVIIGIGTSVGVGASPTIGSGQFTIQQTHIWR
jgi:RHS repeat-associated protein